MSDQGGWADRLKRLRAMCGDARLRVTVADSVLETASGQLATLSSSRLGRDVRRHREVGCALSSFVMDCKRRHESILVASPSAIEPWAVHCAEVMRVPCVRLFRGTKPGIDGISIVTNVESEFCIDSAAIALGDRVLIPRVRRGGRIARAAMRRLDIRDDATVAVAMTESGESAISDLIEAGAVGWLVATGDALGNSSDDLPKGALFEVDDRFGDGWVDSSGQWLVHCTRGANGPWPFETERQYRDAILFGPRSSTQRTALDSLLWIVRKSALLASAITTRHGSPVVCFSGLPLTSLLASRCYRPHLGRWDFEPYGVAIRLDAAKKLGVRPVVYGEPCDRILLPAADRFLFHPRGRTYNWQTECEWRSPGSIDLRSICRGDIRVFAHDSSRSRLLLAGSSWPVTFLRLANQS